MEMDSLDHPDVEQKHRGERRRRRILVKVGRVLRKRRTLVTAFWVASVIIKAWNLIRDIFHGS
jgi:hypothetical protein